MKQVQVRKQRTKDQTVEAPVADAYTRKVGKFKN